MTRYLLKNWFGGFFFTLVLKIKIARTIIGLCYQDTSGKWTKQETKSWAGRPKATTWAVDNIIRVTCWCISRLTTPNITAQFHEKDESTSTMRRLCKAGLYGRIAVKKPLLKKQNNVKRLQGAKAQKDWTIEQWNKVLWTEKSKFNIFGSYKRVCALLRVGKRAATPCITPTLKCRGLLPVAKLGICTRWRANWIRPAITEYCSITRSHLECGLWVKDLYSWHKAC